MRAEGGVIFGDLLAPAHLSPFSPSPQGPLLQRAQVPKWYQLPPAAAMRGRRGARGGRGQQLGAQFLHLLLHQPERREVLRLLLL